MFKVNDVHDNGQMAPCLLPEPAGTELAPGAYTFDQPLTFLLSANAERGEWVAARQAQAAFTTCGVRAAIQPQLRSTDTRGDIVLAVVERDVETFPDVSLPPLSGDGPAPNEAYRLTIQPNRIVVAGATPAGLAHDARTLIQAAL